MKIKINYKGLLISILLIVLAYYQFKDINYVKNLSGYNLFLNVSFVIGSIFNVLSFFSNKEYSVRPNTINKFIRHFEFVSALVFLLSEAYNILLT